MKITAKKYNPLTGQQWIIEAELDVDKLGKCGPVQRAVVRCIKTGKRTTALSGAMQIISMKESTMAKHTVNDVRRKVE